MDIHKYALAIDRTTTGPRLMLARELLSSGEGLVIPEHRVALELDGSRVACAVLMNACGAKLPQETFLAEIDSARELLASSTICEALRDREQDWIVLEDYGMGTVQLWPELPAHQSPK